MALGISGILFALALVVILDIPIGAQQQSPASKSMAFHHITSQAQIQTAHPAMESTFKALVLHPAGRTDFQTIEQSLHGIAGPRDLSIEYHALNTPETAALLQQMRIRMSPNQTMIVIQAANGTITWGGEENALGTVAPDIAFPTPRMLEVIKAAQTGNDVLLVFSDDGRKNGEQLVNAATAYATTPANKAELFVIDPDDPDNQDIIARTKLAPDSLKDARMLLLVGGRVQGQLTGTTSITGNDIKALKKSCSGKSGCC